MEEKHIKMIEKMHEALLGNEYNPNGLINRVDSTERKVNKHEIILKIISGVIIFLVGIAAFFKDIIDIFKP